jgi:hypothetical protein
MLFAAKGNVMMAKYSAHAPIPPTRVVVRSFRKFEKRWSRGKRLQLCKILTSLTDASYFPLYPEDGVDTFLRNVG